MTPDMNRWKRWILAGILFATLWGGALRLYDLGSASLWIDEAFSVQAAQAILERGEPRFETGAFYRNHFFNSYLTAGTLLLAPFDAFNPWLARLPAAFFGTALIPLVYLLVWLVTKNRTLAFITMLLTALSALEIGWSRQIRGYAAEHFFSILSILCLWLFLEKRKVRWGILSVATIAIAIGFHQLSIAFLPGIILILAMNAFEKGTVRPRDLLVALLCVPLLLYAISLRIPAHLAIGYYAEHFFKHIPVITILSIVGIVTAFVAQKRKANQNIFSPHNTGTFMFMHAIVPLLIFMYAAPIAHSRYVLLIMPFLFFFAAYFVTYIVSCIAKPLETANPWFIPTIATVLTIVLLVGNLQFLPRPTASLGYDSPQPDFNAAYGALRTAAQTEDVLITAYPYMTELYLGTPGLWIPFSLSGNPAEEKWVIVDGKERITGTALLRDYDALSDILESSQGFILFDQLMRRRVPDIFEFIDAHPAATLFHHSVAPVGETWIYSFGKDHGNE